MFKKLEDAVNACKSSLFSKDTMVMVNRRALAYVLDEAQRQWEELEKYKTGVKR